MSGTPENSVATFVQKTFEILSNKDYASIIQWVHQGREFIIREPETFELTVIPKYFRHRNVHSFIRQLNMYGFHKSRKDPSKFIFSHPAFLQDREELLVQVRRKIKEEGAEREEQEGQKHVLRRRESVPCELVQAQNEEPTKTPSLPIQLKVPVRDEACPPMRSFDSFFSLEKPQGSLQSLLSKSECDLNPEVYWSMEGPGVSLKEICTDEQLQTGLEQASVLKLHSEPATAPAHPFIPLFSTLHYIQDLDM